MKELLRFICCLVIALVSQSASVAGVISLEKIPDARLLIGDATHAYRDPAAYYYNGTFYLYYSYTTITGGQAYWQTAWSKSTDLVKWTEQVAFTPLNLKQNFCSPGCVVRDGNDFVLCLQTYPTNGSKKAYGDKNCRIYTMRSQDLEHWGSPEELCVDGYVPSNAKPAPRTIDSYLIHDKDDVSKWWCFYKQNGLILKSYSIDDLKTWTPSGSTGANGENACVIVDGDDYVLMYSLTNGSGGMQIARCHDLTTNTWRAEGGPILLNSKQWKWGAQVTAGFILDLRRDPTVGKALLFFHGEPKRPGAGFTDFASIGLAWSDDLVNWISPPTPPGE